MNPKKEEDENHIHYQLNDQSKESTPRKKFSKLSSFIEEFPKN